MHRTAGALLALGVLTSCSLVDDDAAKATTSGSPKQARTQDLGEPAASRVGSADGQEVSVQVWPVQRSGQTTVLNFAMTVDPAAKDTVDLYNLFGDANGATGNSDSAASVDGVKLVDTQNGRLYLVASDGAGSCVCTNSFSGASAEPGEVVNMSATFAAPPEDVTSVSVTIPAFGTFSDVPVR